MFKPKTPPPATNAVATVEPIPEKYAALMAKDGTDISEYKNAGISGTEGISMETLIPPSLIIVEEKNKNYSGKVPYGQIVNTVTGEYFTDTPIIPLKAIEGFRIVEVLDNNQEKLIKRVQTEEELPPETHHVPGKSYKQTPEGYRVYPFIEVYALDANKVFCKILFYKTRYKVARKWLTQIKLSESSTGPAFSKIYSLSSINEEYNGNKYHNFAIDEVAPVSKDVFEFCLNFYKSQLDEYIRKANEAPTDDEG